MSDPSADMECIFPFRYEGVTHNACTKHGIEDTEYEPWCSTKVDKSGIHVSGGGHWGDCGPECPFEPGTYTIVFFALIAIMAIYSTMINYKDSSPSCKTMLLRTQRK